MTSGSILVQIFLEQERTYIFYLKKNTISSCTGPHRLTVCLYKKKDFIPFHILSTIAGPLIINVSYSVIVLFKLDGYIIETTFTIS